MAPPMAARVDMSPLVQKLRDWLEDPKVNVVLLERRVFNSALEIAMLHESMHQYNQRGLAHIVGRLLSSPHARRRIQARSPDRRASREAMYKLREWAFLNSVDPQA